MAVRPPNRSERQAAARGALRARAKLVQDLERLSADAGIPLEVLANAAGVAASYLRRIMAGEAKPTLETYAKLALPLGADLAARLYPNTGPLIRDRHQGRIVEALLGRLHPRWRPSTEVGVTSPARGWIDVVLSDRREHRLVAAEIESEIRRIEQHVRWARMKADSLPSWEGWPIDDEPLVSQLLIVRRTRSTQQTAHEFARQLTLAYPAHPEDALAALMGTAPWPGNAMIWVHVDGKGVQFLATR